MLFKIDLNSDIGESFGAYKIGRDEEIVKYISSANIACGFHAGDPNVMAKTVKYCKEYNVAVGAHPGFPDLLGFGRRNMDVSPEEVKNYLIYQIGALKAFAESQGLKLQHVKAHGALYNMAAKDAKLAAAIVEAIGLVDEDLICVGLGNSELEYQSNKKGIKYAIEFFADRNYNPDGTLVPRSAANAVIHDEDEACRRILKMVKEGKVVAVDGSEVEVKAKTVCIHGDNPKAVDFANKLSQLFKENGIEISPMKNLF